VKVILWGIVLWMGMIEARGVTDREIANMFVLGFEGSKLKPQSEIVRDVCERGLGGVILFRKNIGSTRRSVKALTDTFHCPNGYVPLIAVDQEGGRVQRIRFSGNYPKASQISAIGKTQAKITFQHMAQELASLGINYDFAPVADLDYSYNGVIHGNGRSYGSDPKTVITYNRLFARAMRENGILTSLKHYPGHGSSKGDTHQGFVDVSHTWQSRELEPFLKTSAPSVMVAHVVCAGKNGVTEPGIPASLSHKAIKKLRQSKPHIVVITDDLQMGAIRKYYGLKEAIRRAINAGDDLLLFGNQLTRKHKVNTCQLVNIVRQLIRQDKRIEKKIKQANDRIKKMRADSKFLRHKNGKNWKPCSYVDKTKQRHSKLHPKEAFGNHHNKRVPHAPKGRMQDIFSDGEKNGLL